MTINTYDENQVLRVSVVFTDAESGAPIDATEVTLFVRYPNRSESSFTLSANQIIRTGVGSYRYELVLSTPGTWVYRWQASGNIISSTSDEQFEVNESVLV